MSIADIRLATVEDCRAAWLYCAAMGSALDSGAPLTEEEQREVLDIAMAALLVAASYRVTQAPDVTEALLGLVPDWLKLLQEADDAT